MGGSPVYADPSIAHCWLQYLFLNGVSLTDQVASINFLNGIVPGNRNYKNFGEEAVFGEVSYEFNDQWELLVGFRYARVNFDLDIAQPGVDTKANPVTSLANDTNASSPKVTLTWRPAPDWMIYIYLLPWFPPGHHQQRAGHTHCRTGAPACY